ncbi:Hypothetical_protein [Hexamita inflata]|uniref:Hypothetical_protein n=1 Tax=Hexamita inflata TaxID=28002 RepID=A0AA86QPL2_9EUKA|nr:Hypothetical protein HINF_LOCUS49925 [Hexamita inflata]
MLDQIMNLKSTQLLKVASLKSQYERWVHNLYIKYYIQGKSLISYQMTKVGNRLSLPTVSSMRLVRTMYNILKSSNVFDMIMKVENTWIYAQFKPGRPSDNMLKQYDFWRIMRKFMAQCRDLLRQIAHLVGIYIFNVQNRCHKIMSIQK